MHSPVVGYIRKFGTAAVLTAAFCFVLWNPGMAANKPFAADAGAGLQLDNDAYRHRLWLLSGSGQSFDDKKEEWQSLSPREKEEYRRRMNQLKKMSPEDREHFRRLFQKWQQLSPGEKKQIQRALDNWENLSPDEKRAVRRKFH